MKNIFIFHCFNEYFYWRIEIWNETLQKIFMISWNLRSSKKREKRVLDISAYWCALGALIGEHAQQVYDEKNLKKMNRSNKVANQQLSNF